MNKLKSFNTELSHKVLLGVFLLIFLRIDLVFTNTLPTGGDMGAHVVPTNFFVDNLFKNFSLRGWSNDWFAGYPLYYFYFPIPPIIVSLLSFILPFSIAFKMMVILSQIVLVISVERLFSLESKKYSVIGTIAGMVYIFTESFTIYGGNLASTLAGQYSFTFSLAFVLLGIYFLNSNSEKSLITSAMFMGISILSHIIPFMIFIPYYAYHFLASKRDLSIKISGFLIFLFISIRFAYSLIVNLEYTTNMSYTPYTKISDLIKSDVLPFFILLVIALITFGIKKFNKHFSLAFYLIIFSTAIFFYGPESALWNGRVVPFFNMGVLLLSFQIIKEIFTFLNKALLNQNFLKTFNILLSFILIYHFYKRWFQYYEIFTITSILILIFFLMILVLTFENNLNSITFIIAISSISFLPHWINWNFTGYENKPQWIDIEKLYSGLNNLEPGRIMWEPNSELNKYGTPMVLMTIPYFTQHQSMEGLYFDSSITTPFHFLTVSGLAERPSNPVGGLSYINGDFDKGIRLMKELGIDYFISYTDSIKDKSKINSELTFLFSTEVFEVYKLNSSKIELIDNELYFYDNPNLLDRILNSTIRERVQSSFFDQAYVSFKNETNYKVIEGLDISKINKTDNSNLEVKNLKIDNKSISFETNIPNQLHLIKVSYFPNWKIIDGEGPYRISPSFMAVVPNSNSVSLVFENSRTEKILNYLSFISLAMAIIIFNRNRKANV
jgi:hypothetical protein